MVFETNIICFGYMMHMKHMKPNFREDVVNALHRLQTPSTACGRGTRSARPRGLGGLEPCARCAGKSMAEIGNRKERLRDYASFPDDFDLPRSKVATGLLPFAWDAPPR